jgi:hypothetical protein
VQGLNLLFLCLALLAALCFLLEVR